MPKFLFPPDFFAQFPHRFCYSLHFFLSRGGSLCPNFGFHTYFEIRCTFFALEAEANVQFYASIRLFGIVSTPILKFVAHFFALLGTGSTLEGLKMVFYIYSTHNSGACSQKQIYNKTQTRKSEGSNGFSSVRP